MLSFSEHMIDFLPIFTYLTVFPVIIIVICCPCASLALNSNSNQYKVYRMTQFDLHNQMYGSRQSIMNLEAITVKHIKQSFARKCVLFEINDLIDKIDTFDQIIDETLAAGILIIMPQSIHQLTDQQLQKLLIFEKSVFTKQIHIPIYFTRETKQLRDIYETQLVSVNDNSNDINNDNSNKFNINSIINAVVANGYQMVVSAPQTAPIKDIVITSIQATLTGSGVEDQMPTIAFVAHYDAYSMVPGLSFGADSNGSGIVALLELIRLFSKLYANPKAQPKVNLLFLISGAGKFNYIGSKKWIEEQLDNAESSVLSESLLTICLDSLADSENNSALYMHVSKPPKEGSAAALFFNDLTQVALNELENSVNVSLIHKKINLADETLAWEHERFSIRRLPSFTLSSMKTPKSLYRKTITDIYRDNLLEPLYRNIMLISEATARQLYDNLQLSLFTSELRISKPYIKSLLSHISNESRAQQMLLTTQQRRKSNQLETPPLLLTLERIMRRYVTDVQLYHTKLDPKEPEVVFYEPLESVLNVFNVKPAIFDLFVTIGIASYLAVLYLILINFHHINYLVRKIIISNDNIKIKLQ